MIDTSKRDMIDVRELTSTEINSILEITKLGLILEATKLGLTSHIPDVMSDLTYQLAEGMLSGWKLIYVILPNLYNMILDGLIEEGDPLIEVYDKLLSYLSIHATGLVS